MITCIMNVSSCVLSCLVLSCLVLSCLVLSCLVLWPCLVLSCIASLSCVVLSCFVFSFLVLSCIVLSCLALKTKSFIFFFVSHIHFQQTMNSNVDTDMRNEFQVPSFVSKISRPTFQTDRYQTEKLFSARAWDKEERKGLRR
jgi:hypothetical protein